MKQFYACEMRRNLSASRQTRDLVEHDINTLIRDEAEMLLEFGDPLGEDITDEEFDALVDQKAKEIKDDLMQNGVYYNKFGIPLFLYC